MRKRFRKPNVYAFIDSQNLNLGIQRMGWKMDWRKFRQFLQDTYSVSQAYMFIGYMAENEALYEHMHELGYLVVLKPTIDVSITHENSSEEPSSGGAEAPNDKSGEERPLVKGNVDAELVLYAMKELPHYSQAIIVSGDGDFCGLIEYLAQQGRLCKILTPNWQYSTLLKQFESYIVRLDQKRRQLEYYDRKRNRHDNA